MISHRDLQSLAVIAYNKNGLIDEIKIYVMGILKILKNKNLLITGGTGSLGKALLAEFKRNDRGLKR